MTRTTRGFRVIPKIRAQLNSRKRRIDRRLDKHDLRGMERPMFTAADIHYEIADRTRGLSHGGIGAIHALARQIGLIDAIDRRLHLLKIHLPFHESDHVLNLAYNALCEGTCLQDIELRRNDEVFHDTRIRVWSGQPEQFFDCAIVEMDGTMVPTTGSCKAGMDISHEGIWGYHPLVMTLANTGEVLRIVNRSGNRPSHEGAPGEVDRSLAACFRGGFRRALLRGDTDFSLTHHFDRWDADGRIGFLFGYDAMQNVKDRAEDLPPEAWEKLERPGRPEPKSGRRRARPGDAKDAIVRQREFT